ncbi:CDP-glycerol glycerophosphotransferase family protein [Helicobacter winghamensis]|uniref:CDP-glycerol glycerophosphotransferase family protein n=1 Tax=Helicobacter winghamensis TaxID=157268 RepID=UPI0027A71991
MINYKNKLHLIIFKKIFSLNFFKRTSIILADMFYDENHELIDNFLLFEYMYDLGLDVYYIMNKKHIKYKEIKRIYKRNIVGCLPYKTSWRLLYLIAKTKIWCDSAQSLFISKLYCLVDKNKISCIQAQHGVNYFKEGYRFHLSECIYDKVIVSGDFEKSIYCKNYSYCDDNFIKAGLPRWTLLKDNHGENSILIYFTYRQYIGLMKNNFKFSIYIQRIVDFLNSEKLRHIFNEYKTTIYFAIHHEINKLLGNCFEYDKSDIVFIDEQEIGNIKNKASLLITDFSSMCFDFMYMNKPVIFYNIAEGDIMMKSIEEEREIYCRLNEKYKLLSHVYGSKEEVLNQVESYIKKEFVLEPKEKRRDLFYSCNILEEIMEGILNDRKKENLFFNLSYNPLKKNYFYTYFEDKDFKFYGFYADENQKGRWSAVREAIVSFTVPHSSKEIFLNISCKAFLCSKRPQTYIEIFLNDCLLMGRKLCLKSNEVNQYFAIDRKFYGENVFLKFKIESLAQPIFYSGSSDVRKLGVFLQGLCLYEM